ncbi:MAG TPA: DNA polymerase III subunit alpha [Candidatus Ligilactobacillus excrementigallinarum]|uniref:DNA polymerase III subunit alpha n=1 Tax=Candidatus Ligilactobacillus excrementigallinarum TaxID=2838641 RepID=A0A9D1UWD9_9LACO|nr:DNA polymerase III subunit alpha [Candidatus Ligilactobacillus excrementigallinarum]
MYSPLHVISSFSLLQSTLKIDEYVKRGKELGYQALALTDENVMYGVLDFYQACLQNDIQPIIGLTLQLNASREPQNELILISKNRIGYQNLMKISSLKMAKADYEAGTAPVELAELQPYTADLAVIIPTASAALTALKQSSFKNAAEKITEVQQLFGTENCYLGVSTEMDDDGVYQLRQLENQCHIPLIATQTVRYLHPDESFNVQVLNAIGNNTKLDAAQLTTIQPGTEFLNSPENTQIEFENSGLKDAFENNEHLLSEIDLQLSFSKTQLPHFPTPAGTSSQEYLRNLCETGLEKRLQAMDHPDKKQYEARLEHELDVIHRMGFDDYFLIVWDVTNFSHEHDILVGPGRGSAAGSLVSYTLFITDVDPIKYDLLFERFLNEERAQMPDIDLDIPDQRRDAVIAYVHQRYGATKMAQIITFAHLNARQVIRDVSRVMGQNQFEISSWSKVMPRGTKVTLRDAYKTSQGLKNMIADSQRNKLIFKTAMALEGLPRQYSTHAAGVILSDHDLRDLVPVQMGTEGILLTQFDKKQVEKVGLLKIDFLGLRNLTILENAVQFIKRDYQADFDLHQIPLDDEDTLKLFQHAETAGIFQFESEGIQNVLRQLKPQDFEDIVSTNALFRPGPINNINEFIARKNGRYPITYPNEQLKSILQRTYGIIVYQEQVMQVASAMGGFSLGEADLLRRAMSKKNQQKIDEMRDKFISGALSKGYAKQDALQVYDFIERFGNYGFNRSHSVAYSKLAFQLAYIKCHFPAAFYAAVLNSVVGNAAKTREYVMEARHRGVKVHLPDINRSEIYFILRKHEIYFGFRSIRKLRIDLINAVLEERRENGYFHGLIDFIRRIDDHFLNEDVLQALIYSGAFDEFDENRNQMLNEMPGILESIELSGNNVELFKQLMPKKVKNQTGLSQSELLEKEAEYLGTYVSAHPVDQYQKISEIYQTTPVSVFRINQNVRSLLYLKRVKVIRTKKQTQMAFVTASDTSGEIEMTVFPKQFLQYGNLLQEGEVILVEGKVEQRNDQLNLIANRLQLAQKINDQCYYLKIEKLDDQHKKKLLQIMQQHRGKIPVIIYEVVSQHKFVMASRYWLDNREETISALKKFLGEANVVLR